MIKVMLIQHSLLLLRLLNGNWEHGKLLTENQLITLLVTLQFLEVTHVSQMVNICLQ